MKQVTFLFLLLALAIQLSAQVVRTNPPFPNPGERLTINFNASEGNKGLENCNCDIYVYTGVTLAGERWQNIRGEWGQANPDLKVSRTGLNTYTFVIEDMREFYGVAEGVEIEEISILFHDDGGNRAGRGDGGADIFIEVFPEDATVLSILESPEEGEIVVVAAGEILPVSGMSNKKASLRLNIDGVEVARSETDTSSFSYDIIIPDDPGEHEVDFIAVELGSGDADTASFSYFQIPDPEVAPVPEGMELGLNRNGNGSVTFVLEAPNKKAAFVGGSFNNFEQEEDFSNLMKRSPDGQFFWLTIDGLEEGIWYTYLYWVDGFLTPDPYSELIIDKFDDPEIPAAQNDDFPSYPDIPFGDRVSAFKMEGFPYNWQVTDFTPPAVEQLNIYELLMRDFFAISSYNNLIDTLDYLERLGINAIELMPVSEFENNDSWGYNPSFHMALDKYYGDPITFKRFVDEAHKRGMAVILDVVYNHAFGESPFVRLYLDENSFRPSADNPWLNQEATHPFNVGFDFNHESESTKRFVKRVSKYWLEEYNIDGYRYDLSKGFTQRNNPNDIGAWGAYDASRIAILKDYADDIWNDFPDAILILEHFGDNSEEIELSDYGFLLWGNLNYNYRQAVIGNVNESNFSWGFHENRGWNNPHVVTFMESHDEERVVYDALEFGRSQGSYDVKRLGTALNRTAMAHTFLWTIPGPKMMWQFGELGYDFSINDCGNGTVNDDCRLSRKPIRWDYLEVNGRKMLYDHISDLLHLRNTYTTTFQSESAELNANGAVKTITLDEEELSLVAVGNFALTSQNATVTFPGDGTWYDYFSEQTVTVSGGSESFQLLPGQHYLWLSEDLQRPSMVTTSSNEIRMSANLNAYPNPVQAGSTLRLDLGEQVLREGHLRILDSRGVVVLSTALPDNSLGLPVLEVDLPDLVSGLYVVEVVSLSEGIGFTSKILVNK
jgi:1,4-alpha-glucan branching enzyme